MDKKLEKIDEMVDELELSMFEVRDICKTMYHSAQYCFENQMTVYNLTTMFEILNDKLKNVSGKIDLLGREIFLIK